jgi:uncharacterized membrane protein YraQ (UPF0718 family)
MNYIVLGFVVLVLLMYGVAYCSNPEKAFQGLRNSYKTFTDPEIGLVPLIASAILIGGLVQSIIPGEVISDLLGQEAGLRGLASGSVLGAVVPGGPYVAFPIAGALYRSGASIGAVVAFVSSWSLIALSRLPYEIPFLGVKLVALRVAASLAFPILIGLITQLIHSHVV